jgi:hypothetical protein
MTTDNFCFYFQNRLIQTTQTGGQWYSDTHPFSIPWPKLFKTGFEPQNLGLIVDCSTNCDTVAGLLSELKSAGGREAWRHDIQHNDIQHNDTLRNNKM